MILDSLQGFVPFALYFSLGYLLTVTFLFIYSKVTPHCEWTLVKAGNTTAAIGFAGTLIGFVLPIASAAINAVSLLDFVVWAVIAGVMQLVTFFMVRLYMPALSEKIEQGKLSAGLFLGAASLATGILNAACMTY
ncbi:DUF350 domain-containing protein [Pseudoalteromonas fenneropenaei]|uniref:DUF350 domain-containing protein n=1 Tax=Pseudoalteromonas fenneropenaei TaxID=1737459 RepID=A0ABV7CH39_9GAMM